VRISFEVTVEDVVAAHLLHFDHSPAAAWQRWFVRGIGPVVAFSSLLMALIQEAQNPMTPRLVWFALPLATALGVGLYYFMPWKVRRSLTRRVRNTIESEQLQGTVVGTCTMELAGNRLITKSRLSDTSIDLEVIKSIDEYEDYALVYVTSRQLHIIPIRNVLPEEDYRRFIAALRDAWAQTNRHDLHDPSDGFSERPAI
jgi:hypothetical protein